MDECNDQCFSYRDDNGLTKSDPKIVIVPLVDEKQESKERAEDRGSD
jgi:hypothetical protein